VELEGSVAELFIKVNQDVKTATLKLESGGKPVGDRAQGDGDAPGAARAGAADGVGHLRVHLVSQATGFTNKSARSTRSAASRTSSRASCSRSPRRISWCRRRGRRVKGSAKDDIGLAKVLQAVKVNAATGRRPPSPT